MSIYQSRTGIYSFKHLPGFADFILTNHLDEFVRDQLAMTRALSLPLLRQISHLSDDQIIAFGKKSSQEYLSFLAQNKAAEQLAISMDRWKNDQLQIIGKLTLDAADVTGFNLMRSRLFRKWLRIYNIPEADKFELLDEIDTLLYGATTTALNIFIDLLKGKIAEESHFNQQMINASPAIIFIFDIVRNKEVYINGNVKEVMGYTGDEILSMDNLIGTLAHPDDLPSLENHVNEIMAEPDHVHQLEYRFKHKDGTYRWIRTYDVVFKRDTNGRPLELLGTTFEVSNEKEIAVELEKYRSQLLEAQSIAQIGSFEWDLVRDLSVNTPELLKILGRPADDTDIPTLDNFLNKVHAEDRDKVVQSINRSLVTGDYDCQFRYFVHEKQKFLWTRGRVVFEGSKPVLMRGTIQDISQLKLIENELIKKTAELQRSNESLQQFASIASHDLKEPLRKMSMYTDMVLTMEPDLSEHTKANLSKVKSSSIRMQNMIEDILNFSTITNSEQRQMIALGAIVEEVKEILNELITEKGAVITTDGLTEAFVIKSQFLQLFQNLISNSIKFSRPEEQPRVSFSHEFISAENIKTEYPLTGNRFLRIVVRDNGIGFKEEYAEKIFGLFARLHARASYEGAGLGLAICKRVVENHDGSISATSVPGEGSEFIITIPHS